MATNLRGWLLSELSDLMADPGMDEHEKRMTWLGKSSLAHILFAFDRLGWKFSRGLTFSTTEIGATLGVVNRHRELLVRLLAILAENQILKQTGSGWEVMFQPEPNILPTTPDPEVETSPEAVLLQRCGPRLSEVLQGKIEPLQLLFPDGDSSLVAEVYQKCPMQQAMNTLIQKFLTQACPDFNTRKKRILEIGAGTGGTTACLLPYLSPEQTEFLFTDVSPAFISMAQEKFSNYPFIQFQILNIEQEPQQQGSEKERHDVVLAANVFHATRDLAVTIRNSRDLLAPGGFLVLLEVTAPVDWLDLTFGLTQGWWRFSDTDLRPFYPLLSAEKWEALLHEEGFEPVFSISSNEASRPEEPPTRRNVLPLSLIIGQKSQDGGDR